MIHGFLTPSNILYRNLDLKANLFGEWENVEISDSRDSRFAVE